VAKLPLPPTAPDEESPVHALGAVFPLEFDSGSGVLNLNI